MMKAQTCQVMAIPAPAKPRKPRSPRKGKSRGRRVAISSTLTQIMRTLLERLQGMRTARLASKKLRVCETVGLGEKRSLCLIQVDGRRFLVGSAPAGISVLAELEKSDSFSDQLQELQTQV